MIKMQLTTSAPCRPNTAYTIGGVSWSAKRCIQRKALHRCKKKTYNIPTPSPLLDNNLTDNNDTAIDNTIELLIKKLNIMYNVRPHTLHDVSTGIFISFIDQSYSKIDYIKPSITRCIDISYYKRPLNCPPLVERNDLSNIQWSKCALDSSHQIGKVISFTYLNRDIIADHDLSLDKYIGDFGKIFIIYDNTKESHLKNKLLSAYLGDGATVVRLTDPSYGIGSGMFELSGISNEKIHNCCYVNCISNSTIKWDLSRCFTRYNSYDPSFIDKLKYKNNNENGIICTNCWRDDQCFSENLKVYQCKPRLFHLPHYGKKYCDKITEQCNYDLSKCNNIHCNCTLNKDYHLEPIYKKYNEVLIKSWNYNHYGPSGNGAMCSKTSNNNICNQFGWSDVKDLALNPPILAFGVVNNDKNSKDYLHKYLKHTKYHNKIVNLNLNSINQPFSRLNLCNNIYCAQDICPDGKSRRQIDDNCCACPEEVHNCLTRDTREFWSEEKTKWCCENKGLGCHPNK